MLATVALCDFHYAAAGSRLLIYVHCLHEALYSVDYSGSVSVLHRFVGHPAEIVKVRWDETTQILRVKCRYDPKEYVWDATLSGQMISTREVSHLAGAQDGAGAIKARLGANPFVVEHSAMPDHYALLAEKARTSNQRRNSMGVLNFQAPDITADDVMTPTPDTPGASDDLEDAHAAGQDDSDGVEPPKGAVSPGTAKAVARMKAAQLVAPKPKPLEGLVYATDQVGHCCAPSVHVYCDFDVARC